MIRKSCLLFLNSALLLAGSTQGFISAFEKEGFKSTNSLNANAAEETKQIQIGLRDQVFTERLAQIYSPIDLEFNSHVKKQILRLLKNKKQCEKVVKRSKTFFPVFDNIFTAFDIPDEIKCLAVIESNLVVKAKSPVGALGLWQFMPATAKYVGLEVSSSVDERLNVEKSTAKAAEYLLSQYETYNDWLLALAAYNCGAGNVNKALKKAGGGDYWKIRKYLPRETQNYVPKFIAAVYLMNYHQEHGIGIEKEPVVDLQKDENDISTFTLEELIDNKIGFDDEVAVEIENLGYETLFSMS